MLKVVKASLLGLVLVGGSVLAGCQSSGVGAKATGEPSAQAVACEKCKVTYVQMPIDGGKPGRVVGYRSQKQMECKDCRTHAQNFFTTGKFEHTCKTCGETMQVCNKH